MGLLRKSRGLHAAQLLAPLALLGGCAAPSEPLGRAQQAQLQRPLLFQKSTQPLLPTDLSPNDEFGTAVSASADWVLVGSPFDHFDDSEMDETGSATAFARGQGNVWSHTATLRIPQRWHDARFGMAVAIADRVAAVGAPEADPTADGSKWGVGAVATFAYESGAWKFDSILRDPHEEPERRFGYALAMDDRTLLAGAYGGDQVFAFARTASGWTEPITIDSPSPQPKGTYFGFAVALREPYAFVGAPLDDGDGNSDAKDSGAVYVFRHEGNEWTRYGQLLRNIYAPRDLFGFGVAVRNDVAVGTAYGDTSATIFRLDGSDRWASPFRVVPSDAVTASAFGRSVAVGVRDSVWVGASRDKDFDGSVFPFVRDARGWHEEASVSFTDEGRFGYAVASTSGALLVGAPYAGSNYQGAVYVIETGDGSYCETDVDCASTHCVKGICCNTACTEPCHSCLGSEHAGTPNDGSCEPKREGLQDDGCAAEGPESCGRNGSCDGNAGCAKYPAKTQCADSFCSGNDLVGPALCNGRGDCEAPVARGCKSYACNDGACLDECTDAADCGADSYCSEGRCRPQLGLGVPCSSSQTCQSGHCADGVCCDTACEGSCESCSEPNTTGTCTTRASGSPPRVSAATKLLDADVCDLLMCDGSTRDAASLPVGPSVVCAPAGCMDGYEVGEGRCDGAGQCEAPLVKECGAYACGAVGNDSGRPSQCLTSCDSVDDCATGFYCTTVHRCERIEGVAWGSAGCGLARHPTGNVWSCFLAVASLAVFRLRRGRHAHRQGSKLHEYRPIHDCRLDAFGSD